MAKKHIVSYSGGLNSFATAERVINAYGIDNCLLVFADTNTEDDDLYRFLRETVLFLQCEFARLSDGRDIWQVFSDVSFMGNSRIDPCSRILKREVFKDWLEGNYEPEEAVLYVGFDWNETHRLPRMQERYAPYEVIAPLMEAPFIEKKDIIARCGEVGIEIPNLYKLGFMHNNCGGFCIKAGQAQFKMLLKTMPERYTHHEQAQEELFKKIGKHGFIRIQKKGVVTYLSLKDFREHVEREEEIDNYDFGGCGCFA